MVAYIASRTKDYKISLFDFRIKTDFAIVIRSKPITLFYSPRID
jgi:hypothetical protein